MKYEVGDVVVLKDDEIVEEMIRDRLKHGGWDIDRAIKETLKNKIKQIRKISQDEKGCFAGNHGWRITDEMIERKATTKECIDNGYSDIEYGDRVRVLNPHYGWIEGELKKNPHADQMILERDDGGIIGIDDDDDELKKVKTERKYKFSCNANLDTSGLQKALSGFRKVAMDKSYLRVPVKEPEEVIEEILGTYGIQTLKSNGEPVRVINPYQWLIPTDTIRGMSADKVIIDDIWVNGDWKEEKNEEEDNMTGIVIDNVELIVRLKGVDNGWVITVDDGNKELERIGEKLEGTIGLAIADVIADLNDKELEKEDKQLEIKALEEKLAELKGE